MEIKNGRGTMNLRSYLEKTSDILESKEQQVWAARLRERVYANIQLYQGASEEQRLRLCNEFLNRVRTEEIKAWYSAPEGNTLFQGTSISSLTVPCEMTVPLALDSITELEDNIAESYIQLHDKYAEKVKSAIVENVDEWIKQGLFYGIALGAKVVSQAFGLSVLYDDVVFKVGDYLVDPHEITTYPEDVRREYFKKCLKRLEVFNGIELEQKELESSLVLADISKPNFEKYKDRILLAPVRCNEIAAILSERITDRIIQKTSGRIKPKGLTILIYDTDTPYTYHQIMGYSESALPLVLPGLTVLGVSGTIDAFRWLYSYRVSLIAQKIMKSSLYSEAHKHFIPFVFFGVLVPRDAEILLDMENLHRLRYRGNVDPDIEFAYILQGFYKIVESQSSGLSWEKIKNII